MGFLELTHVRKEFGAFAAVEDFMLSAERGEFVSFLGPSGCGKTTTLRMIAGFEYPDCGQHHGRRQGHHRSCRPTSATWAWSSRRMPCSRT